MICHLSELNNIKLKKNNRVRPPNFWRGLCLFQILSPKKALFLCFNCSNQTLGNRIVILRHKGNLRRTKLLSRAVISNCGLLSVSKISRRKIFWCSYFFMKYHRKLCQKNFVGFPMTWILMTHKMTDVRLAVRLL